MDREKHQNKILSSGTEDHLGELALGRLADSNSRVMTAQIGQACHSVVPDNRTSQFNQM